jgi:hypothetical protein
MEFRQLPALRNLYLQGNGGSSGFFTADGRVLFLTSPFGGNPKVVIKSHRTQRSDKNR